MRSGTGPSCPRLHPRLISGISSNRELVLYREGAKNLVRSHSGHSLIHRTVDRAVERYMAVGQDDADWPRGIDGVLAQHRIAIDRASRADTDAIVEQGSRLNRNFVDHILDAGLSVDVGQRFIAANAGAIGTAQRDYSILYAEREIVEHTVIA